MRHHQRCCHPGPDRSGIKEPPVFCQCRGTGAQVFAGVRENGGRKSAEPHPNPVLQKGENQERIPYGPRSGIKPETVSLQNCPAKKHGAGKDGKVVGNPGVDALGQKRPSGAEVLAARIHHMRICEKDVDFWLRLKTGVDPPKRPRQVLLVTVQIRAELAPGPGQASIDRVVH
ncbi:MAG: hypothetical protein RLZZ253_1450, partial [Verrucomicrobiota bacterium]